jgi:hypothetical protein
MKLLHIIGSMDPVSGGPCQGIRNSNPAMRRLGVYREVVSLDDPAAAFLGSDDFPIHALGPARGVWQYSAKLIPWLLANLQRFDVVVINGLWIFSSYAGWRAMRLIKKSKNTASAGRVSQAFYYAARHVRPLLSTRTRTAFKSCIRNWIYWKLMVEKKVLKQCRW